VTKGSRWDWTIEKATELGATKIVPVISSRTIVRLTSGERAAKRERWQRIAEDAARQSDAKWIPEIVEAMDFEATLQLVKATNTFIGALTDPPPPMIVDALMATKDKTNLAVYVGPEGDFSPEELTALMKVATPVSFGSMILRAETAAIFALSVLSAFKEAK
jgi:16S rRNA (uracil1498-N3)-methyltransferase